MTKHSSASVRTETPHATHTNNQTHSTNSKLKHKPSQSTKQTGPHRRHRQGRRQLSEDVKRRALAIINNKAIDADIRGVIRYGYDINDPWTPDHVRRVEAGEYILDNLRPQPQRR
jgi:hypothetical protein